MESIRTELALYGSKNECARTETVFLPISEVCDGTVSLGKTKMIAFSFLYILFSAQNKYKKIQIFEEQKNPNI